MNRRMTVSEVADRVGRSPDTIRRLEREGVLPRAVRDRNGWRIYPETAVREIERTLYPELDPCA